MSRTSFQSIASNRVFHQASLPRDPQGNIMKVSQYFGENSFSYQSSKLLSDQQKEELNEVRQHSRPLRKELAAAVANALTEWALSKGATHYCHWFQPLTGATAEKHDGFIDFDNERAIEKFSASQLMHGEPDASSFPNGGTRSTFEARGYTTWDMTSPVFIMESNNGKTMCIPTAFVSYHGDALDIKTPLLRSVSKVSEEATKFLNLIGDDKVTSVNVTCGAEQEYFLIDKSFYFARPDLAMSGRTVFGSLTSRNQQLDDHYFGVIPERVLDFMQELEVELYRLGVPAKTRHNEVAPGQFELACIFREANLAADHNQIVMAMLKKIAEKHNFIALLHEKPFAGVNGSGKHLNWSMADSLGHNLLEPGTNPHENYRFLAMVAIVTKTIFKHAEVIRASIASHGNDHRLGANEAPPSILSVFLGSTLFDILESIRQDKEYISKGKIELDLGATQLANLFKDNTDRNRTSPFAFTGNKFEFRAVGSNQAVGFPLSILNACIADVLAEANEYISKGLGEGSDIQTVLTSMIKNFYAESFQVVFNGDGYSDDWIEEANKRGLPNLKNTAHALAVFNDVKKMGCFQEMGIFNQNEMEARYNILLERYILHREIEFNVLVNLVNQNVLPITLKYKSEISEGIQSGKAIGADCSVEQSLLKSVSELVKNLYERTTNLSAKLDELHSSGDEQAIAFKIADDLFPLSEEIAECCNTLEDLVPDDIWTLPKYYNMLFVR